MKLIHVGDLHIGKRMYEFSMLENQHHVLKQIMEIVATEKPEGVLLAGDIYDKSVPSAEAVELFDWFLTGLANLHTAVFIIAGNHDSPERLQFGSALLKEKEVYITGSFSGKMGKQVLCDRWGEVAIYSLPYIKPATVRPYFPGIEMSSYQEAVAQLMASQPIESSRRNVLLCHQFVTAQGGETQQCESELIAVGGVECMDLSLFDDFDYVALGHLHSPQRIGRESARYGGSILKYSFSEVHHTKSVTVVELMEKGRVQTRQIPLTPLYDLRRIKGPLLQLMADAVVKEGNPKDLLQVILTDEEPPGDPLGKLRTVYPNVMSLALESGKKSRAPSVEEHEGRREKSTEQLFEEFFFLQNERALNEEQRELIRVLIEKEGENIL